MSDDNKAADGTANYALPSPAWPLIKEGKKEYERKPAGARATVTFRPTPGWSYFPPLILTPVRRTLVNLGRSRGIHGTFEFDLGKFSLAFTFKCTCSLETDNLTSMTYINLTF